MRVADAYLEAQTRSWRLGGGCDWRVRGDSACARGRGGVGRVVARGGSEAAGASASEARSAPGRRSLAWLVLRDALAVASVGLAVGLAGSIAASRLVKAMMFGISPLDPRVLVATVVVFGVVTCVATLMPAVRAALTTTRAVLAAD